MVFAPVRTGRPSLHARLGQIVAAVTALALAAAGCSYQSTYVAPTDGRARVVWGPHDTPTVDLAGVNPSAECSAELQRGPELRLPRLHSHVELPPSAVDFWIPRYYGPRIVVVRPGLLPFFPRPPLFVPTLVAPRLAGPVRLPGFGSIAGGLTRGGGGGSGSLNLGGSREAGAIVVILLVIAATTLPAVALGLAAATPESAGKTSSAIDLANAYNDLARSEGSPCAPTPPPYPGLVQPEQQP